MAHCGLKLRTLCNARRLLAENLLNASGAKIALLRL
jgi:hypothetical protein